ncbi:hypothetical protein VPHD148_0210 [Vibrio phage D148]
MQVYTFTSEWDLPFKGEIFATEELLINYVIGDAGFEMMTGYSYEEATEAGLFVIHKKDIIRG